MLRGFELDGHAYSTLRIFRGYSDPLASTRLQVSSESGTPRAAIIRENSRRTATQYQAAKFAAARLEDYRNFARYGASGSSDIDGKSSQVWLEDWIPGVRLKDALRGIERPFGLTDLRQLLLDLAEALSNLRAQGVTHGAIDLESVIRAEPPVGTLDPAYVFKLGNLSNSRLSSSTEGESADDRGVLRVLMEGFNSLYRGPDVTLEARLFLLSLRDYLLVAGEGVDAGLALDLQRLRQIGLGVRAPSAGDSDDVLKNPFDFLSAEHFSSEALFHKVFNSSASWLDEVARPTPVLIEGPRGCGKSMALRWMSIKTQLAAPEPVEALESLEVPGFYVACASEVQSRVSRFNTLDLAEASKAELQHYFNMVLLREVASALVNMAKLGVSRWGLDKDAAYALYGFITAEVRAPSASAAGVDPWQQAQDLAQTQLSFAHDALEGRPIPYRLTGASFLHDLARTLTENVPYFASRRLAYCLDDYSAHRIPNPVQQIFNEIVSSIRSGNHVFKLSAETRGFYPFLPNGARIDFERELTRVDVGSAYLAPSPANTKRTRDFAAALLANRLAAASWIGTPEELLGHSRLSDAAFARDARAGLKPYYAGLETIADLCSGDIAHLVMLYKRIFISAGVTPEQTEEIPEEVQDRAIRATSKELFESVRNHVPYGERMLEILDTFSQLAQWALLEAPLTREGGREEPRKQTRIEVDGLGVPDLGTVPDEQSELFIELLRRSVFIELGPGVARRSVNRRLPQQSARLTLRRIYLPAYGLSLSKNMAWAWTREGFYDFLQDPPQFARLQRQRIMDRHANDSDQALPGIE